MQNNSIKWLEGLNSVLMNTSCKLSGKPTLLEEGFNETEKLLINIRKQNKTVWWIGNGGSAAVCSHLSQDMLNKLNIRSMTLNDVSLLTCMANDFGYTNVYLRPLNNLVQDGDLLIAISSSGKSKNILACAELAHKRNMKLITLSGFEPDNLLLQIKADVSFYLASKLYGHVEVGHEALLHAVIETIWINENI